MVEGRASRKGPGHRVLVILPSLGDRRARPHHMGREQSRQPLLRTAVHSSYLGSAVLVRQALAGVHLGDPIRHSQQFHKVGISETRRSEPNGPQLGGRG